MVCVFNFTPVPRYNYRIGVPEDRFYREVINSDSTDFYGSGVGNEGGVKSEPVPWGMKEFSVNLNIPPLGALFFKAEKVLPPANIDLE